MSETPSQPKTTPARRRQGRNNGRTGAHKAYASENDAVNIDPSLRYDRVPRTPQKTGADSPLPANSQASQGTSKQRNRTKPRSKNAPSSPEPTRSGRHTPPYQPSSMKSASATAFAGATFHASPAPSALPLPSFFSKPLAESPDLKGRRDIRQEPSPPSDNDALPTPSHPASVPRVKESPLDFMFRAHREEKERQHRDSPVRQMSTLPIQESPSSRSPFAPGSLPKPSTLPQTARSDTRFQPNGIDYAELEGTPGRTLGPAFSTPYQERIKAAQKNSRAPSNRSGYQEPYRSVSDDPTEALKKFLFNGPMPSGPTVAHDEPKVVPRQAQDSNYYINANPSAPKTYDAHDGRSNNLQAMENDLRRILKLDLTPNASNTERRLFS